MTGSTLERFLPDEEATTRLGEDLALALRAGDVLALHGDLGAGKTTLARGLLRALAGDLEMEAPSPTFTLVQVYETRIPVHHFDLYRLSSPSELDELGFDEALAQGAVLVEWPEKAGNRLPENTVHIMLDHRQDGRLARISGSGPAFERIGRSLAIRDFLTTAGFPRAARSWFNGDASARSYETIGALGHPPRILMNSPALVLGPPVRGGKPYAEIAHTARTVSAFVALDRALKANGLCAPKIFARDLEQGFLLLEHLGSASFLDATGQP
ncbi:MAG: tRNA (adenosine(37)-N6)-threonylcarbamoyltransferase complex ATPase subunit type 1 TsaE, partial [Pseudaminobacter sp.]|nr:tRNA (adenosine(37)-N6)-threonylcarbamoyltransferase complex ATPase subunit type 1 TsaE [Pseudaminobacter sp.]